MKKLSAFILALAMLFSFAACSSEKQEKDKDKDETKKASPSAAAVDVFEEYLDAMADFDSEAVAAFLPANLTSDAINDFNLIDLLDASFEENGDSLSKKYGEHNYYISDVDTEKFDDEELEYYEEFYDAYVDYYADFSTPEMTDGYKIKCKLELKGEKNDKSGDCTAIVIKEDGKWVIWSVDTVVPGAKIDL